MITLTDKEILEKHCPSMNNLYLDDHGRNFRDRILKAMHEFSEQESNIIHELFNKPYEELKPLEDLWRKENPRPYFTIPDTTDFYRWIRLKITDENHLNTVGWDLIEEFSDKLEKQFSSHPDKNQIIGIAAGALFNLLKSKQKR